MILLLSVISVLLVLFYQLSVGQITREQTEQINSAFAQQQQLAEELPLPEFINQIELQSKSTRQYLLNFKVDSTIYGKLSSIPNDISNCPKRSRFPVWREGYDEISFVTGCSKTVKHGEIIIVQDDSVLVNLEDTFIHASLIVLLGALVLGLFTGLIFSSRVLKKVSAFNQIAKRVEAGDLQARMPVTLRNDEYDDMANHINTMLVQLEGSFHAIQGATDAIAHDLRTPLGHLKQQIEFALLEDDITAKQQNRLDNMLSKLDEILYTFTAMLELTRLEQNSTNKDFKTIQLEEIIDDAMDLIQPLCEEQAQQIRLIGDSKYALKGNRSLIFRVIYNLLENSHKYSGEGCEINVEVTQNGFVISDNGIGIDANEKEKVFDRLYRIDESRTIAGFGLGLSLVRAIINHHNGEVKLEDNEPGLKVIVCFPVD